MAESLFPHLRNQLVCEVIILFRPVAKSYFGAIIKAVFSVIFSAMPRSRFYSINAKLI